MLVSVIGMGAATSVEGLAATAPPGPVDVAALDWNTQPLTDSPGLAAALLPGSSSTAPPPRPSATSLPLTSARPLSAKVTAADGEYTLKMRDAPPPLSVHSPCTGAGEPPAATQAAPLPCTVRLRVTSSCAVTAMPALTTIVSARAQRGRAGWRVTASRSSAPDTARRLLAAANAQCGSGARITAVLRAAHR